MLCISVVFLCCGVHFAICHYFLHSLLWCLADGGATLPDLLQWLLTIDRLPLTNGPVYNQKKPKCFLDLDALDDLAEA